MKIKKRPTSGKNYAKYGYSPNIIEFFFRIFFKFIIKIFFIDGNTKLSNIFLQLINPETSSIFQNKVIRFRTGHGRLFWRAKTLHTEEPMMIDWIKKMNKKDIFLDIGANVGTYTIPSAIKCKHVYACELDPLNVGTLKENMFLNKLTKKITLLPFPATSKNKMVNIFYRDHSMGDALQSINRATPLNIVNTNKNHILKQLGFSLNFIFKEFNLNQPTKVKIDVDGNEKEVFAGAYNIIFKAKEVYFEDSGLKDCEKIITLFKKNKFKIISREKPLKSRLGENILFRRKF